jgi:hypothetical protein
MLCSNSKAKVLLSLSVFPTAASASGQDVLVTLWAQLFVLVVVTVLVALWRVPIKRKLVVIAGLIMGVVLAWFITWDIPYRANAALTTLVHVALPVAGAGVAAWQTKSRLG